MSSPTPADPRDSYRAGASGASGLIALLVAMTAVGTLSLNILVPALPVLAAKLQTDLGNAQLTVSLYLLSFATSQLLLGPLSDRLGRRPVILAGMALATLASFAAIFATSITALILARIVQALGASTGFVVGRAIVRDLYERERAASMLGLITSAVVVVPMLAPLIGGILDTLFGWESIFVLTAVFSFAVFAWAVAKLPETRPETAPRTPGRFAADLRALARDRRFIGYVLCGALGSAPFYIFVGGGAHVAVTMFGLTSAAFGVWFACASLGFMVGNYLVSRLTMRFGLDRMVWAGILFSTLGAALPTAFCLLDPQAGPMQVFLPQFLISFGNGLMLPTAAAGAVSIRPEIAGTASGITGFLQMAVGAAVAQLIAHVLAGASSPLPMPAMMLGFLLATGAVFLILVRRRPPA